MPSPFHFIPFFRFRRRKRKRTQLLSLTRTSPPTFHNESTSCYLLEKQMQSTRATEEWTNEKHSMYIKSIEASFVKGLYDSKQMRTDFSSKGNSHESTIGQFKVLRGGCCQKINFERGNPQMSKVNRHLGITANPWIQHHRSSSKQQSVAAPSLTSQVVHLGQKNEISSSSGQLHVCDQDILCNDIEVSDQNFVDDEEVKSEKDNNISRVKRQKSYDN